MAYCDIPGDVGVRVGDERGGRRKLSFCVPVVTIREMTWPQPTGGGGRQPGNISPLLTTTCAKSVFLEGNGRIFYRIYPTYALFLHYYWRSVLISTIFSTKMRSHQSNVNIRFQYHNLDCKTSIHNRKV